MKDFHSAMTAVPAIGPAALSADNTPAAIDLQGYNAAEIILGVGVGGITFSGTNKIEFVVTHSDDDSAYETVETSDILGAGTVTGGIVKALTSAHAAAAVYRFGYVGGRRYLKILADFSGTHGSGTPVAAVVLKTHGHDTPQPNQA
ncbi:hypothetical protein ATO13_23236 [Stappia sp. 22II-S9-Z10]|nr:hypothetical protein ATO13_23236 [Stappia sp. 22II-S9-Z10]